MQNETETKRNRKRQNFYSTNHYFVNLCVGMEILCTHKNDNVVAGEALHGTDREKDLAFLELGHDSFVEG